MTLPPYPLAWPDGLPRTEMRHGGLHIVRQTFKGFVALPAPPGKKPWREKAKAAHPDNTATGSKEAMAALSAARDEALAAVL